MEKILDFVKKYIIYIISFLIIIFLIILLFPKKSIRSDVINKLNKYLKNNSITLTSVEREFTFNEINYKLDSSCYESGLILASTNGYKVYYVCNNEYG